jgi:hypothetical protein
VRQNDECRNAWNQNRFFSHIPMKKNLVAPQRKYILEKQVADTQNTTGGVNLCEMMWIISRRIMISLGLLMLAIPLDAVVLGHDYYVPSPSFISCPWSQLRGGDSYGDRVVDRNSHDSEKNTVEEEEEEEEDEDSYCNQFEAMDDHLDDSQASTSQIGSSRFRTTVASCIFRRRGGGGSGGSGGSEAKKKQQATVTPSLSPSSSIVADDDNKNDDYSAVVFSSSIPLGSEEIPYNTSSRDDPLRHDIELLSQLLAEVVQRENSMVHERYEKFRQAGIQRSIALVMEQHERNEQQLNAMIDMAADMSSPEIALGVMKVFSMYV